MSTSRRWTDAEDNIILITMRQTASEVAVALGRTVYAVEQRRSRLFKRGVLTERGQHPGDLTRTWTREEDALVIATARQPIAEVAPLIPGHTPEAISCRRHILKNRGDLVRESADN